MYEYYRAPLEEIASRLRRRFGDDIEAIYAFGSRVRGDHRAESDFDLLIVIRNRDAEKHDEVVSILVDTEMKYEMNFIPVVKDSVSFEKERQYHTPFYQNLIEEGIPL